MIIKKKIFCFLLSFFCIQSVFSMQVGKDAYQENVQVIDKEFIKTACNVYAEICGINSQPVSSDFSILLYRLIVEVLSLDTKVDDKTNNINGLAHFFALSKRFYEIVRFENLRLGKESVILDNKDFILKFIILWSLSEHLLQDQPCILSYYFTTVLYYVFYFNKDLFWDFFDKYCCVDFKAFANYIFTHDRIFVLNQGYDFKDLILQYFISEFSVLSFTPERIELFLSNIVFETKYKRDLFFGKRNFSLFYFMKDFVFLRENMSVVLRDEFDECKTRESIFGDEQRKVLNELNFYLYVSLEEIEQIKGLFYV